jgi:hypothetical protein
MSIPARFDTSGIAPPAEPWGYEVDEPGGLIYGPGWWPYHRRPAGAWTMPDAIGGVRRPDRPAEPAEVRFAPDCAYYSWRNWYALAWPRGDRHAEVRFDVWIRPHGGAVYPHGGADVISGVRADLDLIAATARIPAGQLPDLTVIHGQAQRQVHKILVRILADRAHRDAGGTAPVTAGDRQELREAAARGERPGGGVVVIDVGRLTAWRESRS